MAAKKKSNRTLQNLVLDSSLLGAFLVALSPEATGLAIHEWLSISFGGAIVVHLVLHWKWVVQVTRRFFSRTSSQARINYLLNGILFLDIVMIMFSGLMISEVAFPSFAAGARGLWENLHETAANVSIALVGLHLALHWNWILNVGKRYLLNPVTSLFSFDPVQKPQAVPVLVERSKQS